MSVATTNTGMKPSLRFPEYSENWNSESLKSAGFQVSDGNYGELYPTSDQFVADGIPFIRANNIKQGSVVWNDMRFIEKSLHRILTSGHLVTDDILVTTRGEIGTTALVGAEFSGANINAQICLLRGSKRCLQTFLFPVLTTQAARKQFKELTTGSALKQLPRKNLMRLKIVVPALDEQKKIADYLGLVDARLSLLGRQRNALREYKKGMMQRLFSQELRFTRDDGTVFSDWQEKRLGEVATFSKGRGIAKADISREGLTPCIRYAELYTIYPEIIRSIAHFTAGPEAALLLSKKGDVIVPASGETALDIGSVSCVDIDGVALGGDLNVIRSSLDGEFLARYLRNAKRFDIARLAQGNSVVHLYASQLAELKILIPEPKEQQIIAGFLSALDAKIRSVTTQMDAMKTFKKGLLQQMFV